MAGLKIEFESLSYDASTKVSCEVSRSFVESVIESTKWHQVILNGVAIVWLSKPFIHKTQDEVFKEFNTIMFALRKVNFNGKILLQETSDGYIPMLEIRVTILGLKEDNVRELAEAMFQTPFEKFQENVHFYQLANAPMSKKNAHFNQLQATIANLDEITELTEIGIRVIRHGRYQFPYYQYVRFWQDDTGLRYSTLDDFRYLTVEQLKDLAFETKTHRVNFKDARNLYKHFA